MADGKHEEGAGVGSEDTVSAVAGAPGLQVRVLATSAALGAAAAAHVAGVVREAVASRGSARVIFATGASQVRGMGGWVGSGYQRKGVGCWVLGVGC